MPIKSKDEKAMKCQAWKLFIIWLVGFFVYIPVLYSYAVVHDWGFERQMTVKLAAACTTNIIECIIRLYLFLLYVFTVVVVIPLTFGGAVYLLLEPVLKEGGDTHG